MAVTRRALLNRIGRIGGVGAAAAMMRTLGIAGMAHAQEAWQAPPMGTFNGKSAIVLGAGIAGLVTAYELEQAGFAVTLLEARDRVGGRAWAIKGGAKVEMIGEETQTAQFADGIYMNAGPARIPSFHTNFLGYARKFNVPLEIEVNSSRSAYVVGADGQRIRMRSGVNDTRGYIAELLSKALSQGSLDQALSAADKEKLVPFLKAYGDLQPDGSFAGTERSGFSQRPGAGATFGTPGKPLPLEQLLADEQLPMTLFEDNIYMQATMFEPVGGMDQVHITIDRNLKKPSVRGAEVLEIHNTAKGATVAYRDRATGTVSTLAADYVICTIPFPVLAKIKSNFPAPVRAAIAAVQYDSSNKVGFEAPRFWERDEIYGGISWVGAPTQLIWYPSAKIMSDTGMILGCYNSGAAAQAFEKLSIADQIAASRAAIEKAHPGHGGDLTKPVAINWHKVPFNLGPWPDWAAGSANGMQEGHIDATGYVLLQQPVGQVYFAGAALSQTPGWQEGGIQSAHVQLDAIVGRARAQAALAPRGALAAA